MSEKQNVSEIFKKILYVVSYLTHQMNQVASSHLLLEKFLEECIQITHADSGSIMLLDEEHKYLVPIVAIGLDKNSEKMHLKIGEGITGWVARERKPRIIDDANKAPDYVRVRNDLISEIAVPMFYENQIIGVLSLDSQRYGAFREEDAILLQIVADLSTAIYKKISDNELLKLREKFHRTLLEVSHIITKSIDLNEIFEDIMVTIQKIIKVYKSNLFLYDKKDKLLKLKAKFGYEENVSDIVYEPGEGITGSVYLNKKPIYISNTKEEQNFLNRMNTFSENVDLSFFSYPVFSESEVIGVFSIFTYIHSDISYKEIFDFFQIISSFIGQALTIQKFIEEESRPFIVENIRLRQELSNRYKFGNLIGKSEVMQILFEQIRMISETKSSVLLIGESGTGKELIASAIHYNSPRKEMPFIKINCAAIPENLLESELFGYKKGAFTGAVNDKKGKIELADGGTVFLDEIGEMDLGLQAKILRLLQEKEIEPVGGRPKKVDIRIIAATNVNLEELIEKKKFRADLYYRLNVIRLNIPPLRERKEDILLLVRHFIKMYADYNNKKIDEITKPALELIEKYDWPGNIRELQNHIERAIVLCKKNYLDIDDFPEIVEKVMNLHHVGEMMPESEKNELQKLSIETGFNENFSYPYGRVYDLVIQEVERKLISYALKKNKYIKTKTAEFLGINRNTLDKKIKELNIDY